MRTGELAERAGVHTETLRYYERIGLLAEPARQSNGYRSYPLETVQRVRFIKRAQALGFSLDEVSELLDLSDARHRRPNRVRAMARARLDGIEAKLDELAHMRNALSELVDACETRCNDDHCPILDAIAAEPADKDD